MFWHATYGGEDEDGNRPKADYDGIRECLASDKITEETEEHLQSIKVREEFQDFMTAAGVMSQKDAADQLFADLVSPGGGVHGTNTPRAGGGKEPTFVDERRATVHRRPENREEAACEHGTLSEGII